MLICPAIKALGDPHLWDYAMPLRSLWRRWRVREIFGLLAWDFFFCSSGLVPKSKTYKKFKIEFEHTQWTAMVLIQNPLNPIFVH